MEKLQNRREKQGGTIDQDVWKLTIWSGVLILVVLLGISGLVYMMVIFLKEISSVLSRPPASPKITHCQLCKITLKKNSYDWTINGEKKRVCPNCNRNLERQLSKEAVEKAGIFEED